MNNSQDLKRNLSFVMANLGFGSITNEELNCWVYQIIQQNDLLPTFFYDLLDTKQLSDFEAIVDKRIPEELKATFTNSEWRALVGIAYKRGLYTKDNPCDICTEKTALKNLEENPHILERFKQTFPFINLEWAD